MPAGLALARFDVTEFTSVTVLGSTDGAFTPPLDLEHRENI